MTVTKIVSWLFIAGFLSINCIYGIVSPILDEIKELPKVEAETKWIAGQFYKPLEIAIDANRNRAYVINNPGQKSREVTSPSKKNEESIHEKKASDGKKKSEKLPEPLFGPSFTSAKYNVVQIVDLLTGKMCDELIDLKEDKPLGILFAQSTTAGGQDTIFVRCAKKLWCIRVSNQDRRVAYQLEPEAISLPFPTSGMWLSHKGDCLYVNSQTPRQRALYKVNITDPSKPEPVLAYSSSKKSFSGDFECPQIVGLCSDKLLMVPNYFQGTVFVMDVESL